MSSVLFTRRAGTPVWIIVVGLVAVFAPPSGLATGALLLVVLGLVVPVMTLLLWKRAARPTIAEVIHPVVVVSPIATQPSHELGRQPPAVAMVSGGLRRRRGAKRRDEGRL